jgi:hypothetical protein
MDRIRPRLSIFFTLLLLLLALPGDATTVLRLSLEQMVERAGSVFRATVLDVRGGSIDVGGGKLPTTTYTLRVDESFKGPFEKEGQIVEITVVGSIKSDPVVIGDARKFSVLPEVPRLSIGSDYLLITTAPSAAGLSVPVGLGQGAFSIFTVDRQELAVNAVGNANLGLSGPIAYSDLAAQIRAALGE